MSLSNTSANKNLPNSVPSERLWLRSELMGTQVITTDTGRRLGVVGEVVVDIDRREVVALGLRDNPLTRFLPGLPKMDAFRNVIRELRVLSRASPLDKEILVKGLRFMDKSVAVTGEGIEDVGCLSAADVGLAMGSGCSAAKYSADLILTDNDFKANI